MIVRKESPGTRLGGSRRHPKAKVLSCKLVAAPLVALLISFLGARVGIAEPTWHDNPTELPALASQSGKNVVLYFESPKSEDCAKMSFQTWPKIAAKTADENFIWVKLTPTKHETFFTYYEIFQTPEMVILDNNLGEISRIKGFVTSDELLTKLKAIPKGKATVQTTTAGQTTTVADLQQAADHRKQMVEAKHFFFESFDDYKSLGAIHSPLFQVVTQAASRIEPVGGLYSSSCLVIDSASSPIGSSIRIDISPGLNTVAQVEGRMKVTAKMRAFEVGDDGIYVAAVSVVPAGESANSPSAKRTYITLTNRYRGAWFDREATTEPFNLKKSKVYLTFQVNYPGQSYMIDDITVDLLPVGAGGPIAAGSTTSVASDKAPDPAALAAVSPETPMFRSLDKNHDGRLSGDELTGRAAFYLRWDANKDGVVSLKEYNDGAVAFTGRSGARPGQPAPTPPPVVPRSR